MIGSLFTRAEPALSSATARDAAAMAKLHGVSFQRGWSDGEFERLLLDRSVVADRAMAPSTMAGFILSRIAAGEAEILSVAVASSYQGRGIAGALLRRHLGRLAGLGVAAVFLEVGEDNEPARKLYERAGFAEVGRRAGYYTRDGAPPANALVLRRDL